MRDDNTDTRDVTVFTLENRADRSMTFRLSGARNVQGPRMAGWQVDFGTLNVQMNDLGRFIAMYYRQDDATGRASWRSTTQEIGKHIYQGLLNVDPSLARHFLSARRRSREASALSLVFAGSRDYLSVPYELLHDGQRPLGIQHPLARQLTGSVDPFQVDFHTTVEQLRAEGQLLRVLLISSGGWLVAADDEINALHHLITSYAARSKLPIMVEVLPTGTMTLDDIRDVLRQPYHVIHYAGQVYHDRTHDTHNGLLFGGANASRTGHALLTVRELLHVLPTGTTQLVYLSACMGPLDWDEVVFVDRDHLGVMGELVRGGVSTVLSFRWQVTNTGRLRFAQHFYDHLLSAPFAPEHAAQHARRAIYDRDSRDETWLSPVLIVQHAYTGKNRL